MMMMMMTLHILFRWICGGRWQRWLCVFGFLNLPELLNNDQDHMLANKFDLRMDPVVIQVDQIY